MRVGGTLMIFKLMVLDLLDTREKIDFWVMVYHYHHAFYLVKVYTMTGCLCFHFGSFVSYKSLSIHSLSIAS